MYFSQNEQCSVPKETNLEVVVDTVDEQLVDEAAKIKEILGDPQQKSPKHPPPSGVLYFGENGVELRSADTPHKRGFRVDFSAIERRVGTGNLSRRQPLPRAIGRETISVVDATAGFGKDAVILALMGFTVVAIEKSPVVAVMLRDGLRRAIQDVSLWDAIGGRLQFIEADSVDWLSKKHDIDTVYVDPMFPPKKKKSALPPGHIQLLQSIVGDDQSESTQRLFRAARQIAKKRVVVKRPNHAPHFSDHPVAIHQGKLVRYEVYHPQHHAV